MKYIKDLLNKDILENNEYEFKLKLENKPDKIEKWAKTLVGFANSNGGYLLVGVTDDGIALGLTKKEIDETKNLVLLSINRYIFPHIQVKFETILSEDDRYVLTIYVEFVNEMIIFKAGDFNEKVYIRDDGATIPASVKQIVEMSKRKFGVDGLILNKFYEKKDFTSFNKLAKFYREDNLEPTKNMLINSEVMYEDGRITHGLYMFSDSYNEDDTLVCCRLWNGYTKGVDEVFDKKEFKGNLCDIFENVMNFIKRNTRSGFVKLENGGRLNTYSYPEEALREAIVNALAHRDYSIYGTQVDVDIYKDRLVIGTPGTWVLFKNPSEYNLDDIPSVRRNKIISNCFEIIGLMEKSGSGFKKINEVYSKFDVKKPLLKNENNFFWITFYDLLSDERIENYKIPHSEEVLEFCKGYARSKKEIQEYLGISSASYISNKIISPLVKMNLLKMIGEKNSRYNKYISNEDK